MTNSFKYDDESVLSIYLKEINKIPLLSREEEDCFARNAAKGDKEAIDALVKSNLRFVVNVAKKYQNQGLPLADLINEGNIGLMNAIEKYDVDKGYHFISYAVWWIRQAILKAICDKSRMIRLPLNRANELIQIERTKKSIMSDDGDRPDAQSIASVLNMEKEHVENLMNVSKEYVSLETPVYDDRDSSQLGDFIEDEDYVSPEEAAMSNALRADINILLETLSEKESRIIELRFGLNGAIPMSLKEIGDTYNLTKERIRQIEKKALGRLRHPSRRKYLESYVEPRIA